jgi:hypothetical protein
MAADGSGHIREAAMKHGIIVAMVCAVLVGRPFQGRQPGGPERPALRMATANYPIRAVPITNVRITDEFWAPRMRTNRTVTIPHIMRQDELTGRVDNFLKAARKKEGSYQGQRYNDTDIYKVIEAASYSLAVAPDPALDRQLDELIAIVAAAQEPDGYLYTPRSVDPKNPAPGAGPERWSWLHTSHELYDQGRSESTARLSRSTRWRPATPGSFVAGRKATSCSSTCRCRSAACSRTTASRTIAARQRFSVDRWSIAAKPWTLPRATTKAA